MLFNELISITTFGHKYCNSLHLTADDPSKSTLTPSQNPASHKIKMPPPVPDYFKKLGIPSREWLYANAEEVVRRRRLRYIAAAEAMLRERDEAENIPARQSKRPDTRNPPLYKLPSSDEDNDEDTDNDDSDDEDGDDDGDDGDDEAESFEKEDMSKDEDSSSEDDPREQQEMNDSFIDDDDPSSGKSSYEDESDSEDEDEYTDEGRDGNKDKDELDSNKQSEEDEYDICSFSMDRPPIPCRKVMNVSDAPLGAAGQPVRPPTDLKFDDVEAEATLKHKLLSRLDEQLYASQICRAVGGSSVYRRGPAHRVVADGQPGVKSRVPRDPLFAAVDLADLRGAVHCFAHSIMTNTGIRWKFDCASIRRIRDHPFYRQHQHHCQPTLGHSIGLSSSSDMLRHMTPNIKLLGYTQS
ncbi:hypothetical protein AK830_g9630 [Neonectria ditissima]|uniref:Uncharacterized protein n=1 Tax=Neonectria ditissima TaxID=78410 RepID=A0A0P7B8T9_9HYPO|nr:hypothetical protein AK830_g9630 [Neonectria ditissima]